ncbi:MAG: hypothetical protein WCQ89_21335 [Verrucomicrobiota bacterium]
MSASGHPCDWLYARYDPGGGATAQAEFAHDASFKLYTDGKFFNVQKDDSEKSPLAESALGANAKAAKAKLQAALRQFEGPRPEFFAKQGKPFREEREEGEESGPGAPDNKKAKRKN